MVREIENKQGTWLIFTDSIRNIEGSVQACSPQWTPVPGPDPFRPFPTPSNYPKTYWNRRRNQEMKLHVLQLSATGHMPEAVNQSRKMTILFEPSKINSWDIYASQSFCFHRSWFSMEELWDGHEWLRWGCGAARVLWRGCGVGWGRRVGTGMGMI